jgi:hypothetical protein
MFPFKKNFLKNSVMAYFIQHANTKKNIRKRELTCFTYKMVIHDELWPSGKGSIFDYGGKNPIGVGKLYNQRGKLN